jgi:hypothetical protein
MAKKCSVCGAPVANKEKLCNRCVSSRDSSIGSCTGVKYPCKYHCKQCFYVRVYMDAANL